MDHLSVVSVLFAVSALVIAAFALGWTVGRVLRSRELSKARAHAVRTSEAVIRGHAYEKILPFLPEFPYDPSDMVFVGRGVDYVVFDGLSRGGDVSVVFLEVKSWQAKPSPRERAIERAVKEWKLEYRTYRIPA